MGKKEQSRAELLLSAKELFIRKTIDKTTMEDIGKRAGLTRRTVYRHFASKEEIAFEVVIGELEYWNNRQQSFYDALTGNGLERLNSFLTTLANDLHENIDTMALFADFDFYFSDTNTYEAEATIIDRFNKTAHFSEDLITMLVQFGIDDQSIAPLKNKELTILTISNVLWGFGQHVALRKEHLREEFSIDPMLMIHEQIAFYIRGLENHG